MTQEEKLLNLKARLQEITDLYAANYVLGWDQSTYMPKGGAEARGRQIATLSKLAHQKFTDPALGNLLEDLRSFEQTLPYDSDNASLLRFTRKGYGKALKVPDAFVATTSQHFSDVYELWAEARLANDYKKILPALEKTLELSQEFSSFFSKFDHVADPHIDAGDEGMTVATVRPLFASLRQELVPLVEAIPARAEADDSAIKQFFPEDKQLAFGLHIAQAFGYDLARGRQDKTLHPFATHFSVNDVRITTRVKENDLSEALFSTLHEAGHAMYEQGVSLTLDPTPLAAGTSSGVHESQSRLWENVVGRSFGFWQHYYPKLQKTFPERLNNVPLEAFYKAINKVSRSLIRTDADEVTYNLHVIIRFDLECELLEDKLSVKDLPEAWCERYKRDLGVFSETDTDGVLQDVHWFSGFIGGAFQGYAIGNILSSQFYDAALQAHPEIPKEIIKGQFSTLHTWMRENIYQHGSKFTAPEIIKRATGQDLTIEPYVRYLKTKYGELYQL
ncbi:MAG: carboxypeptidase M32 [Trueperaceae bacterium]